MPKIELGGGTLPKQGFINIDLIDSADIQLDLDRVGRGEDRLPFENDAVDEVYSSHCFEHLGIDYGGVLHEIVRVCRVGAKVEIRVPHWNQSMAMCSGHNHTIGEVQVRHWCVDFLEYWWKGCTKRLKLVNTELMPNENYKRARMLFFWLRKNDILRFIPDTCAETRFTFEVIPYQSAAIVKKAA